MISRTLIQHCPSGNRVSMEGRTDWGRAILESGSRPLSHLLRFSLAMPIRGVRLPASHRHLAPLNLVLAFLTLAGCAHAPQPVKSFPQFTVRKPKLECVKLLCQVCVMQAIEGDVHQVLLDETSALGSEVERWMKDALVAKGYPVDASSVSAGPDYGQWTRPPSDTTAGPPHDGTGVFSAPFIRDTTLFRNPAIVTAWTSLLRRLSGLDNRGPPSTFYEPKSGESPLYLTEAVMLCDSLGGGAIAAVNLLFVAWRESRGHTLEPARPLSLFEKLTGGRLNPSGYILDLTLLDGKPGEVLWHDREAKSGSYDRKLIETMMASVIEKLP